MIGPFWAVEQCWTTMLVRFSLDARLAAVSESAEPCKEILQALHARWRCRVLAQGGTAGMARMDPPQTDLSRVTSCTPQGFSAERTRQRCSWARANAPTKWVD